MPFKIILSDKFRKNYKKLSEPVQKQIKNKIKLLMENPMHPSLRTKRIQGTSDLFECSVNMNVRIIWHYGEDFLIILLDVGHHDILNKF